MCRWQIICQFFLRFLLNVKMTMQMLNSKFEKSCLGNFWRRKYQTWQWIVCWFIASPLCQLFSFKIEFTLLQQQAKNDFATKKYFRVEWLKVHDLPLFPFGPLFLKGDKLFLGQSLSLTVLKIRIVCNKHKLRHL